MIVAETPDAYRFVTQPAHARLAGQFAVHWEHDPFERPEPFPAVVAAAVTHDDGWWPFDRQPHLGDDGTPVNFTELPPATWIELYDRGIDQVVDLDRYAGLLVSMHGTGLRRRRYGLSPSWPDTPPAFEDFVARQEGGQRDLLEELEAADDGRVSDEDERLLDALHERGTAPDGTTSGLWTNYQLLQAWDSLSLSFVTSVAPPDDEVVAPVPCGPGRRRETLALEAGDDATHVDPYPFDDDPFVARVPARSVPKAAASSERDLVEAYYAAGLAPIAVELRPGG